MGTVLPKTMGGRRHRTVHGRPGTAVACSPAAVFSLSQLRSGFQLSACPFPNADSGHFCQFLGAALKSGRAQQFLKLRHTVGSDNRRGHGGLFEDPGQRHLGRHDLLARRLTLPGNLAAPSARTLCGSGAPRSYLPVSRPPPSGLQGTTPVPSSTQTGNRPCSKLARVGLDSMQFG